MRVTPSFLQRSTHTLTAEVLLSLLLANFTFECSDKRIVWNFEGVRYPSVGQNGGNASLPMILRVYPSKE